MSKMLSNLWAQKINAAFVPMLLLAFLITGCTAQLNNSKKYLEGITDQSLKVDPVLAQVKPQDTQTFTAGNGQAPYTFSLYNGGGSIDPQTGVYLAPLTTGTSVISATDAKNQAAYATVVVYDVPSIAPSAQSLAVGNSFTFAVSGGSLPYRFSVVSGAGRIDAATGTYTAANTPGSVKIRVTDSAGHISESDVTVFPALAISNRTAVINANGSFSFSASGGVAPYTFSMASGLGSIDSAGVYNAPLSIGTDVIRVTDHLGNSDIAVIRINSNLLLGPASSLAAQNSTSAFQATGGVPPYSYSIQSGGGSINASTGVYTAPLTPGGPYTVTVTDATGATSTAQVNVTPSLSFSAATIALPVNGTYDFSMITAGGVGAKVYSITSAQGTFVGSIYTAPNIPGSYTVTVFDSQSPTPNQAIGQITVHPAISVWPATKTIAARNTQGLSVSGGLPPYTYAIQSGGGTVGPTGIFTAPSASGATVIKVTDSYGSEAFSTITINPALQIIPAATPVPSGGQVDFNATGGVGQYTFTLLSGTGNIHPDTGLYTAPNSAGLDVVQVQDEIGNISQANVTIVSPLMFSPSVIAIQKNSSIIVSAMGGLPPFNYNIQSGGGSIDSTTGKFIAPATPGISVIRVTDQLGTQQNLSITVYDGLLISPVSKTIIENQQLGLSATGGEAPYTFTLLSGAGVVTSSGTYTAPNSPGSAVIRVTDSQGNMSDAQILINDSLSLSPANATLSVSLIKGFTAAGGIPPYLYSVVSGQGSINMYSGDFQASSSAGATLIQVTDSSGATATSNITVNGALSMSPVSQNLAVNATYTFAASGGVPPYTYSVPSGFGAVGSSSGVYTASGNAGVDVIRVTDSIGSFVDVNAQVFSAPVLSPGTLSLAVNNTKSFSVTGGKAPYAFSRVSGVGNIDPTSGEYSAGGSSGVATIQVTDSLGQTAQSHITINNAISFSPISVNLAAGATQNFTVSGGVPPYSYLNTAGIGSFSFPTYTAPLTGGGTTLLQVMDSVGNQLVATITNNEAAPTSLSYTTDFIYYTKGVAIPLNNPTSSGGAVASYSVSPALPTGLSFNTTTGVISGTPTIITSASTYTVTATNTGGSTTKALTIAVNDVAPMALVYLFSPVVTTKNTAIMDNTPTSLGGSVASYSVSPALPTGISLNTTTGVISGTPTVLSTATDYTITATNSGGSTSATINLTVHDAAPTAMAYSTPNATYTKGTLITANTPSNSGGAVISYSVSPALPAGLSLNSSSGMITGIPTDVSVNTLYTVTGTNSGGSTTAPVQITINDAAPTTLTYSQSPAAYVKGTTITANTPSHSGGTITSYSISPALPAGLSFNTTTGVISGTPTVTAIIATYTITGSNVTGSTTFGLDLMVADAAPTNLTYATTAASYLQATTITANTPSNTGGAITSYTVSPALPAGLSLNTTTGVISGTPTGSQSSTSYTITGGNFTGSTTTTITITIASAALTSVTYPNALYVLDANVSATLTPVVVGAGPPTNCVSDVTLPTGLSIHPVTCVISGTPTGAGGEIQNVTITASNAANSVTTNFSLRVIGSTGKTAWIAGSQMLNQAAVPGNIGVAAPTNYPPGLSYAAAAYDKTRKILWIFGGQISGGVVNALWKWDGTNWTWVKGSSTLTSQNGVYGTKGTAASANTPGSRYGASLWIDSTGNVWLFGGLGFGESGSSARLNDLWKFNGTDWTWVNGSKSTESAGFYSAPGVVNANNNPASRSQANLALDSNGKVYMYGGDADSGYYADLWTFTEATGWVLLFGSNAKGIIYGNYGVKNVTTASNKPGGRTRSITWMDSQNNFYMYGGSGYGASTNGLLADMWKWDGTNWTWISGSSSPNIIATPGVQGTPSSSVTPGSLDEGVGALDAKGNLWVSGGFNSAGGITNTLWKWDGTNWTWVAYSSSAGRTASYGTKGIYTSSVEPGARGGYVIWFDENMFLNIWGGLGYNASSTGRLNDHFRFIY